METPIADFVRTYERSNSTRLHMPGHKGRAFLGCEALDITEIQGADALYEAEGIIARSEKNAASLFGTTRTLYSTEGSSQCIRAMLYLALQHRLAGTPPVIVAARNVHKAFVFAAALLDFEIVWLWPEGTQRSLCSCNVTPEGLEKTLESLPDPPAAVYVTSPDYLGAQADIAGLARIAHRHGTILTVDNAHGAYLRFLEPSEHPMDLGADLCCDSAHKTLPVLTGGAYLHVANSELAADAKIAMALFGSTSPSYLTLTSLDLCNRYLSQDYAKRLAETVSKLEAVKIRLRLSGWQVPETDPLKLTIDVAASGHTGTELAELLRHHGVECEFADPDYMVLMVTPENTDRDVRLVMAALEEVEVVRTRTTTLPTAAGERRCSVRAAMFAPHESVPVTRALGRTCGAPTVSCPPAIPVAVSGEAITQEAIRLFDHYGIAYVDVVKE